MTIACKHGLLIIKIPSSFHNPEQIPTVLSLSNEVREDDQANLNDVDNRLYVSFLFNELYLEIQIFGVEKVFLTNFDFN